MNKLPTFEECLEITKKNEAFTHRIRMVNGFEVSIFDYLMAGYNDFAKPIADSDITAFELRGLAFVHYPDGTKKRSILLNKFFNLNQVEPTQYELVKDKKIRKVMDKMDGSVMSFLKLPNDEIVIKTKTFFDNDQTTLGKQVYDSDLNLQQFVKEAIDSNLSIITELTSPANRIVLGYAKTELTLLQLRDQNTGEYLDIYSHPLVKKYDIKCVKKIDITSLDELIELAKTVENIEGWVVEFEDGLLLKIKVLWYVNLHGLVEKISTENFLMQKIVENEIDDIVAELDILDARRATIDNIVGSYNHYIIQKVKDVIEFSQTYKGDRKKWAIEYRSHPLFPYAVKIIDIHDLSVKEEKLIDEIKKYILKETRLLNKARAFIAEELRAKTLLNFESP